MNRFSGWIPYLKGFAGAAVLAAFLAGLFVGYVAWVDHQRITAVWEYVNAQAAAAAKAK